ncbi:TNF receptor-associated factor 5-like isoform X2 [Dysidea avara]
MFFCEKCKGKVAFKGYFHDKAISKEINYLIISCPQCNSWTGEYHCYQNHIKEECQLVKVSCPNEGCSEEITRSQIDDHLQHCQYRRESRTEKECYDEQKEHERKCTATPAQVKYLSDLVPRSTIDTPNPNNNSEYSLVKKATTGQNSLHCLFAFLGCQSVISNVELETHLERYVKHHLSLVGKYLSDEFHQNKYDITNKDYEAIKQLLHTELDRTHKRLGTAKGKEKESTLQITGLQHKQDNIKFRLTGVEDLLTSLQASINEINHTYEEVSLTLQTLQATSYDGHYIWKIPDITRRRRDALLGKTVSLYSAPFYTSRFGYRLCLRVYLDGDGSGKGHYISYFLTIMKGEYDALLEWPFQHMVTMTLVNQKGNNNIVQSFRPNPTSTSFHQPKSDMNVASGCPKFAPLSILDNPEFVVEDVAFFKCVIK